MKLKRPLVVLDLETTGTWIDKDKIIEMAMIKCFPDGQKETYHEYVNPGISIPDEVIELTGITNDQVRDKPHFTYFVEGVIAFLKDCDYGGFNVERFDLPLLEREINEAGSSFNWRQAQIFDAQVVYHQQEKRDLKAAYEFYCNKDLKDAHSALADTQATLEILEEQVKKYGHEQEGIDALSHYGYKATTQYYDADRRFRWWNGKLYMMFGKYARRYTLQELVQKDKGYCQWILNSSFSDDIKALISDALEGKFPVYMQQNSIEAH